MELFRRKDYLAKAEDIINIEIVYQTIFSRTYDEADCIWQGQNRYFPLVIFETCSERANGFACFAFFFFSKSAFSVL